MNIEATCPTLRALLPSVGAKHVSKVVYAEAVDWSCKAWRLIDSNQTRPNDHDTGRCKLVIQGAISFHYMSSSIEAAEQSMPGAVSFDGIVHEFMEDVNSSCQALRKRDAPAIKELLQCSSRLLQVDMLCHDAL